MQFRQNLDKLHKIQADLEDTLSYNLDTIQINLFEFRQNLDKIQTEFGGEKQTKFRQNFAKFFEVWNTSGIDTLKKITQIQRKKKLFRQIQNTSKFRQIKTKFRKIQTKI